MLVLDHGRVSQLGTPEELGRQEGLYRQIMEIQGFSPDPETKKDNCTEELKEVNAE